MLAWVIYDITNDKIRNKVIRICKDNGLYRVQKSVFLGEIADNIYDELLLRFTDIVNLEEDSIYVFPMSKKELKMTGLIGKAFDKDFVSNEVYVKFF